MVLPLQVREVFYVNIPDNDWVIAIKSAARDNYNLFNEAEVSITDDIVDPKNTSYLLDPGINHGDYELGGA